MAGSDRLRVGIVGLGAVARARHVPGLRAIDGVEIVAVANRTAASSRAVADELGIPRTHRSWRALVADPEIDAVVVAAWPNLHEPVTLTALAAGRHVLVEGRMAGSLRGARRMLAASEARPKLVAMVVPAPFSLFCDVAVRRLLADGAIGDLRRVRATWTMSADPRMAAPFRFERRLSGVNVMALGIVYEGLARWLGEASAVQARARLREPLRPTAQGEVRADVPDELSVLIDFPNDVTGAIEMATYATAGDRNEVRLFGTKGTLVADLGAERLGLIAPNGAMSEPEIRPGERGEWRVEAEFVDAIRKGTPVVLNDFRTGVGYMAFTDAVVRAARSGRRVIVSPP
jgi:predicted dehydrogenase